MKSSRRSIRMLAVGADKKLANPKILISFPLNAGVDRKNQATKLNDNE